MKTNKLFFTLIACGIVFETSAQVVVTDPGKVAERSVENRANNKVYQGVDKGLDKVEEGIGNLLFGKKKKKEQSPTNQPTTEKSTENQQEVSQETTVEKPKNATLQTYRKFDFVPGEKILVIEDFNQDAIGDFPDKWNTNSNGEIVTIEGKTGKWFNLGKMGVFNPEFITNLPENFTLEFDAACTPDFSFYSTFLHFSIAELKNPAKDFIAWSRFEQEGREGVEIGIHPKSAGGNDGITEYHTFSKGTQVMKNETSQHQFHAGNQLFTHVSIWRQKQRLRVYLNEDKIWDIPKAFQGDVKYTNILFETEDFHDEVDKYYITNIRLAVGAPDTRNKLLTEGKFVTTGITFGVNSSVIKPESFGTLKMVADALKENPEVKIKIIGHTDADGDDASNLALSKKRAEAIKVALSSSDFGIDVSRMETDGKGESQPVGDNKTVVGKANNRRVEFVKL